MKAPSIRRRLLVRCGAGVGVLLCLLSLTVYLIVRRSLHQEVDWSITQTASLLANEVEMEDGHIVFEWQEGLGTNEALPVDCLFEFWDLRTGEKTRSPALRTADLPRFEGPDGKPAIKTVILPNGRHGRALGMHIHPYTLTSKAGSAHRTTAVDVKEAPFTLVVASDTAKAARTLKRLRLVLFGGALLTLALGFGIIDRVIRLTLRPIGELARQVNQRADHQIDLPLELPGELPTELGGLARDFGSLLSRMAHTRQRERDFLRHAAHELRTPIAGLRATMELALSQPRDAATYSRFLTDCCQTTVELSELVRRLSALARIGDPTTSFDRSPLDPCELLAAMLPRFEAAAADRGIRIITSGDSGLQFTGDATLCRVVLANLLDNAVCYAARDSEIMIRCERGDSSVQVVVGNAARDLPADPLRLFEPLFRRQSPDENTASKHLGIGLTLSLDAAHAMGGSLTVRTPTDGWIEFVFALPSAG